VEAEWLVDVHFVCSTLAVMLALCVFEPYGLIKMWGYLWVPRLSLREGSYASVRSEWTFTHSDICSVVSFCGGVLQNVVV
jgi:hypothetical protein